MSMAERDRLRQLVSDYYHGLVTQESYREQRALLLDNIGEDTGDEPEETATRPRADKRAADSPAEPPKTEKKEKSASSGIVRVLAGIVVVAGIAGAAFLLLNRGPATDAPDASAPSRGASLARGDALVDEFLSSNDWSSEGLGNFLLAWEALDSGQREQAAGGRHFRSLTTRLHQRIREEMALGASGDELQLAALTDFADEIGVPFRQSRAAAPYKPTASDTVTAAPPPDVTDDQSEAGGETQPIRNAATAADGGQDGVEATGSGSAQPDVTEASGQVDTGPHAEPQDVATTSADPVTKTEPGDASEAKASDDSNPSTVARDDPCPAALANTRRPYCQDVLPGGSKGPVLVVLPTGSFRMGDDSKDDESPAHDVDIVGHIAMSRYEITADEFARFCQATSLPCPTQRWEDDAPVVDVSWDDAVLYTEWLSEATGFIYRLPSESEWEYAARAGTQTPYFFGDEITPSAAHSSAHGNPDSPVPKSARVVNRNPFRLYHMSGNVREWVGDAWYPNYEAAPSDGVARVNAAEDRRVVRGGSYEDPGDRLRSAARDPLQRSQRDAVTGIRIVREVE